MKHLFRLSIVIAAALLAVEVPAVRAASAGEGGAPPALPAEWDLKSSIERAVQANPAVVAARIEAEREQGARLQVQARLLPRVAASASTDDRDSTLIDRSPAEFAAPPSQRSAVANWGYDMRLEVRQLVFDGLAAWQQLERQKIRQRQALLNLAGVASQTVAAVRQAHDAALVRRAQLAAERQRVSDLSQLAEYAARKRSVGEIAELDLLNAQSQLQSARAEQADIERELTSAEEQFSRLLNLPAEAGPPRLAGEFGPRAFDLEHAQAVALALKRRPDLESAVLAVEASKRQQRALTGEYLPRFEAYAAYTRRSSYYNSTRTLDGWTVGAVGSWSLFDGGESRGRRRVALAERRLAESRLEEMEMGIRSRLRELYQGLAQSREAMAAQATARDLAARAFAQSRRLYENGRVGLEQVLQAQMLSRQAENRHLDAVYRFNSAVAQIEHAIGGGGDFEQAWKP